VRYDNETGKGGHRHLQGREMAYSFKNVEVLVIVSVIQIKNPGKAQRTLTGFFRNRQRVRV
jgi:hypothetical protein